MRKMILAAILATFILKFTPIPMNDPSVDAVSIIDSSSSCDWPMAGRNSENIRVAPNECGPKTDKLEKIWSFESWGGYNQPPIVVGERLYLITFAKGVVCLEAKTGTKIWVSEPAYDDTDLDCVSLAYDDGMVYVDGRRHLKSLDAMTGKLLWEYDKGTGYAESDIIPYKGNIFFMVDSYSEVKDVSPLLHCINGKTGMLKWKTNSWSFDRKDDIAVSNGKVFVTNPDGNAVCFDAENGWMIWLARISEELEANPCVYGGKVFISTKMGSIVCLEAEFGKFLWRNKKTVEKEDRSTPLSTMAGFISHPDTSMP